MTQTSRRNLRPVLGAVHFMALIAAGTCWPAAAAAQVQMDQLSAVDLFELADKARASGQMDDAIALYDALARDPDPEVRAEARFRKGMMFADARRYADAAVAFRALLDEKPEAARARLELARMLAAMGEEASARRALRQAQATGLPPEVSASVNQFARALRSQKPFGGSVGLALAPDSNINRATQARTLDTVIAPLVLSEDARAKSGLGLKVSGEGFARLQVQDGIALLPRLSSTANLYRSRAFEDISGSALLGVEWQGVADRVSPSVGLTRRWYGGRPYARTLTAAMDWLHVLGPRSQLVVSGSASRANYIQNELQNGAIYDLNVSLERAFDARTGGNLTVSGTRQTALDPGYATAAGGASVLAWHEIAGATLFASAGLRRTEGDARLFLFPERRREWLVTARAGATLRQWSVAGFAPIVRLAFEQNKSTVGIYDYQRFASEIGIVRAF